MLTWVTKSQLRYENFNYDGKILTTMTKSQNRGKSNGTELLVKVFVLTTQISQILEQYISFLIE